MDELSDLFGGTEQLWDYILSYASSAGREATRVILELYYVVKSPLTPVIDKTVIVIALGYQLLPDDKKLISIEKHGLFGLIDNAAALTLAYNRVQTRITPQIEAQVDAILNQWFGADETKSEHVSERIQQQANSESFGNNDLEPQPVSTPVNSESPIIINRHNSHSCGFNDDEEVVVD